MRSTASRLHDQRKRVALDRDPIKCSCSCQHTRAMSKAVLRYPHRAHGDCLRALRMLWRGGCTPKVKIQSAFDWVTIACPPQTRCTWTCTEHDRSSTRSGLQQRAQRAVQWRALAHFGCTVVWQRCRAQLPRYGRKCQRACHASSVPALAHVTARVVTLTREASFQISA